MRVNVAVCCSVLQCVAAHGCMLQCVGENMDMGLGTMGTKMLWKHGYMKIFIYPHRYENRCNYPDVHINMRPSTMCTWCDGKMHIRISEYIHICT